MAGQCRKSPFCACAACALDRQGEYMVITKPMMQKTTKRCRKCGCEDLIELSSIDRKRCANCRRLIYWPLTEGQKPLL